MHVLREQLKKLADQGNLLIDEYQFLMNFFCVEFCVTIFLLKDLKALLKGFAMFADSS